jgi:hypothetical protein
MGCPLIVYTDVDTSWLFGIFGENQVMAQRVARRLLVSPLINRDFRGCSLMLAGGNIASATLNQQNWTRAQFILPTPPGSHYPTSTSLILAWA